MSDHDVPAKKGNNQLLEGPRFVKLEISFSKELSSIVPRKCLFPFEREGQYKQENRLRMNN